MTLVEALERNAGEFPEKCALIDHNAKTKKNYRELNETANRLADFLLSSGLRKGDLVGLMMPRAGELVEGFLGVAKARGIVAPVNYEITENQIRSLLSSIEPFCLIVHSSLMDLARKTLPADTRTRLIVVGEPEEGELSWHEALAQGRPGNLNLEITGEDAVYLNYTSGSTGDPKGAVTTHANIYWNTRASVEALGLKPEDIHLCMFASFAHPHELFSRALYTGGISVLLDKIYPKSLAEAIENHRVSCMMGLAPMYDNLLKVQKQMCYNLASLRIPESGGMFTRKDLRERFKRQTGVEIIPVWGSTETTGIALANRPGKPMADGSVGKPCSSYEVRIIGEQGEDLPPEQVGDLLFRGPAVVTGYFDRLSGGKECLHDGWYHSGDLGKKDKDGNIYFMGRKTGMMKVAGLKVYPLEVEQVLLDIPGVKEAAVVSAEDRLRGEVPKAIVGLDGSKRLSAKDILSHCRENLANYKLPRLIEIRDSLPKTGSGKIDKKLLQKESNESTGC